MASLVECAEALTVVLAVGITRGWRSAIGGSAAALLALLVLLVIVALPGSPLARVPLGDIRPGVGALAALLVVVALGVVVHGPLARVPENTLKFIVGVLLCAFGTFWAGEGMGYAWPYRDLAILALIAGWLLVALLGVRLCRGQVTAADSSGAT